MIVDAFGKIHGSKKGKSLRIIHLASNIPLFDSVELLTKAYECGGQSYYAHGRRGDKGKYLDSYVPAFLLAYTNSYVVVRRKFSPLRENIKTTFSQEHIQVDYPE